VIAASHPGRVERAVQQRFPDLATHVAYDELTVYVPAERILDVLEHCRDDDDLVFDLLSDLSGVHWPGGEHVVDAQLSTTGWPAHRSTRDEGTIEVTYHLLSIAHGHRVRLVVAVPDDDPRVPSAVAVYPTAAAHERETFDMFGVTFEGHPNLTRILMPDDWIGHPQRKDYPLGGVDTPYHGAAVEPPDERLT
jgi:NADH-quinone oxidoreductase subunit C